LAREGQVIVCENEEANWLPFRRLGFVNGIGGADGSKKQCREVFYVRRSRPAKINTPPKAETKASALPRPAKHHRTKS
jgi:hypothetical protein